METAGKIRAWFVGLPGSTQAGLVAAAGLWSLSLVFVGLPEFQGVSVETTDSTTQRTVARTDGSASATTTSLAAPSTSTTAATTTTAGPTTTTTTTVVTVPRSDTTVVRAPTTATPVRTQVTTAPLSCPDGTYVNTAGNEVCRPFASDTPPPGATARCKNGQYSFSQSRQGTCSGNGGVAQWL